MNSFRHPASRSSALAAIASSLAMLASTASDARVTRLEILSVESPNFEGLSFGSVGQYEKIRARAYGEVDPADPRNAIITDIALAPRNQNGNVEYSTDVYILKPINMANGNGRIFYEVVNRGSKLVNAPFLAAGGSRVAVILSPFVQNVNEALKSLPMRAIGREIFHLPRVVLQIIELEGGR